MHGRTIKPGFWRNENLAELPYEGRLLFIGLWMLADREGRLEDRPRRIKMEIFPADNIDLEPCLDALVKARLIVRYQVGERKLIWIPTFEKHQHPHPHEPKSVLPP